MKIYKIVTLILVVAFGLGVYFTIDFSALGGPASGWKKTDIGQTISQVGKQIFTPSPLNIGGAEKNVVLLQGKIILETNLQRQENSPLGEAGGNLLALRENAKLNEAALAKAHDMFLNQYFEHVSLSGIDPGKLVQVYGYEYITTGENLILGNFSSEKEVVQAWMDSPGHRANILNNRYTEIGVAMIKGVYKGENVWIGVQEFGSPLSTCAEPNNVFKNQIDLDKAQLEILSLRIDEKKNQIENTNRKSAPYKQMVDDYNQLVVDYNLLAEKVKEDIIIYNDQVNIFNNCVAGVK